MGLEIAFVVCVAVGALAVVSAARVLRRHRARWRATEMTVRGVTRVGVAKPGCRFQELARFPLTAGNYDQLLSQAEADAVMKAAALNSSERSLSR